MKSRWNLVLFSIFLVLVGILIEVPKSACDAWHVRATPAVSQEVQFSNGDAHLVGTLYLPIKGDHLPAVVALHSASAATRDAALYRHLTEALPAMGIAVLIYDRRGAGKSSGTLENIDFGTLADDAIAGQRALAKTSSRIDPKKIGFWGLSQGGWLAVLAAVRSQSGAFAISVSAPLVSPEEQMQFAMTNLMTIGGYSAGDIQAMLDTRKAWTGYLRGNSSRATAISALQKAESKPWFKEVYLPESSELTSDPEHNSYRKEMDDDPVATVLQAHVPVLFLYGDSDPWVPVAKSVVRLQSLANRLHNLDYAIVSNADHEMMFPVNETMRIDENTIRNHAPQAPSYFTLLGSWLSLQGLK